VSIDADLWPIPTPPASAVVVDLAPGVLVTLTPALAGCVVTATPGGATATTDGSGIASVPTGNGDYTLSGALAGYTVSTGTAEVRDDVPAVALTAVPISSAVDPRPLTPAADILAVRLLAITTDTDPPAVVWPEVWYSDLGITTDVPDTPSAAVIEDRLVGEVRYQARVVPLIWGRGEGAAPVGQLTLANGDGALDGIVGAAWTGRIAEIYRGDRNLPVEDWTLLVRTRIAEPPTAQDEESVVLTLGSIADRLDQPIQTNLFAPDTPAEALRGQPRPFGVGYCYSVPVTVVDPPELRYELHDGPGITIDRVRAAGNELDPATEWTASSAGFTLDTNPFGARVVADVLFGADATPTTVIGDLLARAGIATGDVDWSTMPWTSPIGVWSGTPQTGAELLSYLLDSFAAGWYVDRLDRLAFWALNLDYAEDPPVIRIEDLTDQQISISPDLAPGYVMPVCGLRNWHVHAPGELAGALIDPTVTQTAVALQADYRVRRAPLTYDPTASDDARPARAQRFGDVPGSGLGTAHSTGGPVLFLAANLSSIFRGASHVFASLEMTLDVLDVWIGQWLLLDLPRFGLVGPAVVVGIDAELGTGATRLTLWVPRLPEPDPDPVPDPEPEPEPDPEPDPDPPEEPDPDPLE
jgi:hypothetical protein